MPRIEFSLGPKELSLHVGELKHQFSKEVKHLTSLGLKNMLKCVAQLNPKSFKHLQLWSMENQKSKTHNICQTWRLQTEEKSQSVALKPSTTISFPILISSCHWNRKETFHDNKEKKWLWWHAPLASFSKKLTTWAKMDVTHLTSEFKDGGRKHTTSMMHFQEKL